MKVLKILGIGGFTLGVLLMIFAFFNNKELGVPYFFKGFICAYVSSFLLEIIGDSEIKNGKA